MHPITENRMSRIPALDPRDYAIIRALGALNLGTPNVELARAFLRDAGADERIHLASVAARRDRMLSQAKVQRVSDMSVQITFPSCRLVGVFEQLLEEQKEATR